MIEWGDLHLLRPQWLWAWFAVPVLAWAWHLRQRRQARWRTAVDAHLLPHLLASTPTRRTRLAGIAALMAYVLGVLALAGPSWRQGGQPLWSGGVPLVVALDLSSAASAGDLPPSRLAQARAKLARLMQLRKGAPVALVVYADDAYTVAPLTDDAANVALFIDSLSPDVMPVDGQRPGRAIERSVELLQRAGHRQGEILLLTGEFDAGASSAAVAARSAGYQVSVLGLGSTRGALFRSRDGAVRQARLDPAGLQSLARAGGGRFVAVTADDADLQALGVLGSGDGAMATGRQSGGRVWLDEGYWLIPPLMALALLMFRRRSGTALVLLCLCLPWTPAQARDWWQRPDQAVHEQLQRGNQAYREKRYAEAAALYRSGDTADAHYNRGNALGRAGQYPQAIAAYDEALRRQPGMPDALANRRAVEAAMKRKPPPGPRQGNPQAGAGKSPGQSGQGGAQSRGGQPAPGTQDPPQRPTPPRSPDAQSEQAQRNADEAQRERMQRALASQRRSEGGRSTQPAEKPPETAAQRERRLANEAWLRRIPDDPGGLLRAKLRLEHERRQREGFAP